MSGRSVLVVGHPGRPGVAEAFTEVAARFARAGVAVQVLADEAAELDLDGVHVVDAADDPAAGCEVVVVLGGDGTLLRAAELARGSGTPLLGVNLGHVGFLAEAEHEALAAAIDRVVEKDFDVDQRLTLDVSVLVDGSAVASTWALNEASVEKASRERMLELVGEVDGRPISRWGCDGVVMATPTGSTAYAFSAGGPIVWPEVAALLMIPISAHALFARPMVVSPDSVMAVEVVGEAASGVLWCDSRRSVDLPRGARIEVRRGAQPVPLVRLGREPFTDRLVAKFELPVRGWRGARRHQD